MNGALVTGLAVIGLPWLQRMAFWRMAAAGKERIARVRVNWPARLRFRHACFLLVGMATLLFAYAPYAHQQWIYITLSHWAAGNSSFTYLVHLVVIYLPMGALIAIAFALTGRDRVAARSHALAPEAAQITEAEFNWLSGFAMAFGILSFACWMLGYMIQRYLE